ncbi:MAG TPA: trypsin-like peptidase domain-containing protein, partial [Planctomycetota bacterium]|nr:trypsin-like peptidase domain-containing protein [Planctomycetota bacterium]
MSPGGPDPGRRPDSDLSAHASLVRPSVFAVEALGADGGVLARGAGFLVGDGRVATARHLLEGAASARVRTAAGKEHPATGLLAEDAGTGLALLLVPMPKGGAKPLPVTPRPLHDGERVLMVGSPAALEGAVAETVASDPWSFPDLGDAVPLQGRWPPESSGCPVLRRTGEVAGVALAPLVGGRVVRWAVPAVALERMAASAPATAPWKTVGPGLSGPALAGLGALLEGNSEEAVGLLSAATERDPKDALALCFLAEAHRRRGVHPAAAGALEKASAIRPDDGSIRLALAAAYTRAGRSQDGVEVYKSLLRTR